MKDLFITEQELEYLTDIPSKVSEEAPSMRPQKSFEEEAKNCITLEEFSRRLDEAIRRMIPNP